MEYLYVVLVLLILYLFMNKCACKRVEGLSPGDCCNYGDPCDCSGLDVFTFGAIGNSECADKGMGYCK
uniref:Uncharacterized protein n=1 Tax=viral metagenome TaxID=1070528 RepID=A0A6C0FFX6_9ZZZZ